ncbi:MAG: flagellar basal body rod protein FlgB [Lachnospiraceae bacterium]|nr:flagellar basal body rod protein FlgB [Lachnospiraceae bacterium]
MINSSAYNYINVLDKAADASWLRESAITNNIAIVDTPGYKRQDVDFEGLLKTELRRSKYESLDNKVKNIHLNHLNAKTYTDSANYSYRLDDNNVDIDTEEVELASEQLRYTGLANSITHEFTRLKSVMG